ncbi:hypothetical protein Hanom_Chr03g00215961 [Helianthus anomalus]
MRAYLSIHILRGYFVNNFYLGTILYKLKNKKYINSLCIYLEFTLHTSLNTTPIPPKHNNNHQIQPSEHKIYNSKSGD